MEELMKEINFINIWWQIFTPLILIIIDVLTGLIVAWKNNNFQSSRMREGLSKKFGEIVYIIIGIIIKFALGTNLILGFTVIYICLMEISSLAENCDKLGVPLPKVLCSKLNNAVAEVQIDNSKKGKIKKDEK